MLHVHSDKIKNKERKNRNNRIVIESDSKVHLPFRRGKGWSSTSWEFRYLELPCDFLVFFFSDRLANGSILSTMVVVDMLVPKMTPKTTTDRNTIYNGAAFTGRSLCISHTSDLTVSLLNVLSCQIERIPFERII